MTDVTDVASMGDSVYRVGKTGRALGFVVQRTIQIAQHSETVLAVY